MISLTKDLDDDDNDAIRRNIDRDGNDHSGYDDNYDLIMIMAMIMAMIMMIDDDDCDCDDDHDDHYDD